MRINRIVLTVAGLALSLPVAAAETAPWTLAASVQRAHEVAPERQQADARVAQRAGELRQAGAWPNPVVEVSGDQALSMETGDTALGWRYVGVSQPLPLLRLARQRRAAEARLAGEQESRRDYGLQLEHKVAQAFHALQLAAAHHELARERFDAMEAIIATRDRLVRYLAPADRLRLDILRAQADQAIAATEGELTEAASRLRTLLALPADDDPRPVALAPVTAPPPLDDLLARLESHPGAAAARLERDAARAEVDAARSQRFADPAVSLFRERDIIGGVERDYSGVGLSVQLPLWNLNGGGVERATGEAAAAHARMQMQRRDLDAQLRKSYLHLRHLIEQAEQHRRTVLEPGQRLFGLARRSFAAGENNVLALVDAHDGYFGARNQYIELLTQQWLEAADLRYATAQPLLDAGGAP